MPKHMNQVIATVTSIEEMAHSEGWLQAYHPFFKLCITIIYMILLVSFPIYDIYGPLSFALYPLFIFECFSLSYKEFFQRLKYAFPLIIFIGILNPLFDPRGWYSCISLWIKGFLCIQATYILIVTTTIEQICFCLRLLHVPRIMVTQIMLVYRYIHVLLDEVNRMLQAYFLRAPKQNGIHYRAWGSFVGQLLLRTMKRADDIYESMLLRGYNGNYYLDKEYSFSLKDCMICLCMIGLFVLFRLFPIVEIIGNMFVR